MIPQEKYAIYKRAKEWMNYNPEYVRFVASTCYVDDGKMVSINKMTRKELFEQLSMMVFAWRNITQRHDTWELETPAFDEPLSKMKMKLKWYYSPEAHSCILQYIVEISTFNFDDVNMNIDLSSEQYIQSHQPVDQSVQTIDETDEISSEVEKMVL